MSQWPTYRTIIFDKRAESFLGANAVPGERFEEQWRGIEWLLSRKPDVGAPRYKSEPTKFLIYVVASNGYANMREVWVLYSFDDSNVTIHAIEFGSQEAD
jgi:hypothetical protein